MEAANKRSLPVSPRDIYPEVRTIQTEDNTRPDDGQPPDASSVTVSPRQPSVPVAETISIQPSQNQGPGSDRVDGVLRQVQIAGPRSIVPHDTSSIVTPASRASFRSPYRPYQSLNMNPQIVPQSVPRVAWVNPVSQPYNTGHTQALTTAPPRSVNSSNAHDVLIIMLTVRRRQRPLRARNLTPVQAESELARCRELYDREYLTPTDPSLTRRLELASRIIEVSVNLADKYKELDITRIIELNKEKHKFLHLTQAIGILEKYASNLIKPVRPPYWRSVKFTSNLIQIHIRGMEGSMDILHQMGYTVQTGEGLSFPDDVLEPDIEKIRKLAPDLFLARFDIDALVVNKHPRYEVDPPIPREETELPILFSNRPPPVAQFPTVLRPVQAPRNTNPVTGQQPRIITMVREPQPLPGGHTRNTPRPTVGDARPMVMERTDGASGHSQPEPLVAGVRPDVVARTNENITTQRPRIVTMAREPQPLPRGNTRDTARATVGGAHSVVMERADGPLVGSVRSGEGTSTNESIPTPSKRQMREPSRTSSVEQQVESDDSEYEDAQDTLPSGASLLEPAASGGVCADQTGEPECSLCGEVASIYCGECNDSFCGTCDITYHKHKLRQSHKREKFQERARPRTTVQMSGTSDQAAVSSSSDAPPRSPRARKPVPTPRRRLVNQTLSASSENISSVQPPSPIPRQPLMVGSEPSLETVSKEQASKVPGAVTAVAGSLITQTKVVAQGMPISGAAEQKDRHILRPPPYGSVLVSEGHRTSGVATRFEKPQEVKNEQDQSNVQQEIQQPEIAKSEDVTPSTQTVVQEVRVPRTSDVAKSCTNCFCLNNSGATTCVVCGSDLKQDQVKVPIYVPTERKTPIFSSRQFSSDVPPSSGVAKELRNTMPQSQRSPLPAFNSQANTQRFPFSQMMTERTTASTAALKSISTPSYPQTTTAAISTSKRLPYQKGNERTLPARPSTEMQRTWPFSSPQKGGPADEWACEHCTLLNPVTRNVCELCCKTRPDIPNTVTPANGIGNVTTSSATGQGVSVAQVQPPVSVRSNITSGMEPSPGSRSLDPHYMTASQKTSPAHMPEFAEEQPNLLPSPPPDFSQVSSFYQLSTQGMFAETRKFPISSKVDQPWPFVPSTTQIYSNEQAMTMPPVLSTYPMPKDHIIVPPPLVPTKDKQLDEAETRRKEEIFVQGLQFVEWMREAERGGFTVVELNIATNLGCEESLGPVHWLKTKWHDLIHQVLIKMINNAPDLGNVSPEEARNALIEGTGDVQQAVKKCTEERKKKLTEVMKEGVFTRADCVSALDNHNGDVEKSVVELQKKAFEPMLQRIKDSCLPDEISGDALGPEVMRQLTTQTSQEQEMFDIVVSKQEMDFDRRVRMLLVEKCLQSWGRAETAIKLIDRGFAVEDAVDAARQCGDLQRSLRFLKQECPLCFEERPMNQMITFLNCQDRFCSECVKQYLAHTITNKNIKCLTCPLCAEPKNLDDESVATEYFNNMDIIIRELLDDRTHDLFQKKVRDRTLNMKEPNFRWCSHCSNGFINENPLQLNMQCPHCGNFTCFKCKKQWEDQHQGISCEQFAAWKEANDPERQAAGLASHLHKNGIECPHCKFRYDLAKGGCMHFKCAMMCSHEFCSGCYSPFNHGQNCTVSEECANKGLHAHHPRDCLFYMRDNTPEKLQKLLRDNNVEYNTEPPQQPAGFRAADSDDEEYGSEDEAEDPHGAAAQAAGAPGLCKVMEQKEGDDGLIDAHCDAVTPPGYGGLCKLHYTEYLVELINDNFIDPAELMTADELKAVLQRQFVAVPQQELRETDENYQLKLLRTVKEELPLPRKPPRKRVLDDVHDDDNANGNEDGAIGNPVAQPADLFDVDFNDDNIFGEEDD